MPTLGFCTGFEHGSNAGLATGNAGNKFADIMGLTVSTSAVKNGTYGARATAVGQDIEWTSAGTIGASKNFLSIVFWLRMTTAPSATVDIFRIDTALTADRFFLSWNSSNNLHAELAAGQSSDQTLSANTWYLFEIQFDCSTANATVNWKLNGATQTSFTVATTASTLATVFLGAVAGTGTITVDIDDVAWSTTSADGYLGEHKIVLLSVDPAGTVTLSGTAANFNTFTNNGTLAAWDATTARNNIDEVPPTIGATADGWVQITLLSTDFVEMPMTTYTLQAGETISGGRMLVPGWATSTTAATIGFRSWNGTTETTLFATADPNFDNSTTTPAWVCKMLTLANIDTQGELDALAFRAGFSGDATPDIGIHAIYAEIAIKVAAAAAAAVPPPFISQYSGRW